MLKFIYRMVLVLTVLYGPQSLSDDITMATLDWPPYFSSSLPKNGVMTELVRQVLKKKNHNLVVTFTNWNRAIKRVERGKFTAALGCWTSNEREKKFLISEPLLDGGAHFLAPLGSKLSIKSQGDLEGKRVGLIRGYAMSKTLKQLIKANKVRTLISSDHKKLFKAMAKASKKDSNFVILENSLAAQDKFKKLHPNTPWPYKKVGDDFFNGKLYVCFSRKHQKTEQYLKDFNEGLKMLKADGSFDKIVQDFGFKE